MSALARFFKAMGKEVSGYDKMRSPLTDELEKAQIYIHFQDHVDLLPAWILDGKAKEEVLIIYTPAIPKDHCEMNYLIQKGYVLYKRSEVLGFLTKNSFTVAVAGTHGKTTTSSIVAHLLCSAGVDCTAFLGGIAVNYQSNLLLGAGSTNLEETTIVVEADEFDRSFLTLFPDIAVITSMDPDHLDIYGDKENLEESYRLFAGQVKEKGFLFYKAGLPIGSGEQMRLTYSIAQSADVEGRNIRIEQNRYIFDCCFKEQVMKDFSLGLPGRHNVENAVAAIAVAMQIGVPEEKIRAGLMNYRGVKRRFEMHIQDPDCTFLDDYAHHPEELRSTISSVRELHPNKRITGIFQPHLYSRTRDFADGFADSLSLLDELILLDIYPARELPIPGITSQVIFDQVKLSMKTLCKKEDLMAVLERKAPEVLITLGAGDIDQFVYPIRDLLLKKLSMISK